MATKPCLEVVNEDTVQCYLFITPPNAEDLHSICKSINETIQTLAAGYIWHRDGFSIHVPIEEPQNSDQPVHLFSSICFGDNLEDEWFIVYLILEITKQYSNIVVRIFDNDGEFLLIEAADVLPPWANPDNTENRVFIYQNQIHLIPSIVDLDTDVKLSEAIKIITETPEQTASPEIYKAILNRISGYPDKIEQNTHKAIVKLPVHIAALLKLKPSLVSPLTSSYCNYDAIEAKNLKNVKFEGCVTTQVKFTKCLYAMLIHSKLTKNVKHDRVNENDKKSALGLKLTCGYEIIMSKLTGDIFSSKEFSNFIKSLTSNGYFRGNLVGSKDYKQLLENAKEFFLNMESPINLQICNTITELMKTKEFIYLKEKLLKGEDFENLLEDSDDWLNINPDELNDLLNSCYGEPPKFKSNDIIDSQKITSELSNFLKQTSDFEGIETKEADDDSEDENIEFDSEQFINSLKNMMSIVSGDNNNDVDIDSDDFSDMDEDTAVQDLDRELEEKLETDETNMKPAVQNIIQSLKEEEGSSGPSSIILRAIGINKTDVLNNKNDKMK